MTTGNQPPNTNHEQGPYSAPPSYGSYAEAASYMPAATYTRRPGTVLAGCIMTWVGSALGLIGGLRNVQGISTEDRNNFNDVLSKNGKSPISDSMFDQMSTYSMISGAIAIVACLAAIVLAILTMRRSGAAAKALVGVGILYIIVSVIFSFLQMGFLNQIGAGPMAFLGLIGVAWILVACFLIYGTRAARDWFTAKAAGRA